MAASTTNARCAPTHTWPPRLRGVSWGIRARLRTCLAGQHPWRSAPSEASARASNGAPSTPRSTSTTSHFWQKEHQYNKEHQYYKEVTDPSHYQDYAVHRMLPNGNWPHRVAGQFLTRKVCHDGVVAYEQARGRPYEVFARVRLDTQLFLRLCPPQLFRQHWPGGCRHSGGPSLRSAWRAQRQRSLPRGRRRGLPRRR